MIDYLKKLITFDASKKPVVPKKILCIIEGKLELDYIMKIFQLFGYTKACYDLTEQFIKVAWGNHVPLTVNIVDKKCEFQGGSLKNNKTPQPAIQTFELFKDSLNLFDSIIVLFDGDEDKNNEVEKYFIEQFKGELPIKNYLLVSKPCFESTLIDFCRCNSCRKDIENMEDARRPCDKYKNKFSSLKCFSKFTNDEYKDKKVTAKGLVTYLDMSNIKYLETKDSKLNTVNLFISEFMKNKLIS